MKELLGKIRLQISSKQSKRSASPVSIVVAARATKVEPHSFKFVTRKTAKHKIGDDKATNYAPKVSGSEHVPIPCSLLDP